MQDQRSGSGASKLPDGDAQQDRLASRHLALLPSLTREGVKRVATPLRLQQALADWLVRPGKTEDPEASHHHMFVTEGVDARTSVVRIDADLNRLALSEMQPLLEEWCGYPLEPVWAYGIRVYSPGNVLQRHIDLVDTHVISASLLVAQDVDTPWPFVVENRDGSRTEVLLEAGEAVLYESARLPHFRDARLQGRFYAALFVHFRPVWWSYTSETLKDAEQTLPPGYPRRSLRYGRTGSDVLDIPSPATPGREAGRSERYLAFDTDIGGWHNILMQFEIMVLLAWLTGRTLVLPPPTPFYLLGKEPRELSDFLDIDALRAFVPVITAAEYGAAVGVDPQTTRHEACDAMMQQRGHCPPWNALEDVLVWPADALDQRPELAERVLGRRIVNFSEDASSSDVLYFPKDTDHRMFGVAETFFLLGEEELERSARTVLRDGVRYREDIVRIAERALDSTALAGGNFAAMHVRRGDFQYEETQVSADEILANIRSLLEPGQTVYLATDEPDAAFFDRLREHFHVVTFADLPEDVIVATPDHLVGIVETLVCAGAPGIFVGTRLSTFTARIQLLRGHLSRTEGADCEGIDTALYYTQPPRGQPATAREQSDTVPAIKHSDPFGETAQPWWRTARRSPLWGRAYRDCWAATLD